MKAARVKRIRNNFDIKYINIRNSAVNKKWAVKVAGLLLGSQSKNNLEITVVLSNNGFLKELNRKYRHKNTSTDVLSFVCKERLPGKCLKIYGDIVISVDTAKKQAAKYCHNLKKEIAVLIIHGFYHVLGYNHYRKADYRLMKNMEIKAINLIEKKIGF